MPDPHGHRWAKDQAKGQPNLKLPVVRFLSGEVRTIHPWVFQQSTSEENVEGLCVRVQVSTQVERPALCNVHLITRAASPAQSALLSQSTSHTCHPHLADDAQLTDPHACTHTGPSNAGVVNHGMQSRPVCRLVDGIGLMNRNPANPLPEGQALR
jgi:hypothetical protein